MYYSEKKGLFSREALHFFGISSGSSLDRLLHHHYSADSVTADFPAKIDGGVKFPAENSDGRIRTAGAIEWSDLN